MNNIFKIIIGFFIIVYLIYFRVLWVRIPRQLYSNLDLIKIIFYFIILMLMLILLCFNIYKIFTKNNTNKKQNYFSFLKKPLNAIIYIKESMISFDVFLKNLSPDYDEKTSYFHKIIEDISKFLIKYKVQLNKIIDLSLIKIKNLL